MTNKILGYLEYRSWSHQQDLSQFRSIGKVTKQTRQLEKGLGKLVIRFS